MEREGFWERWGAGGGDLSRTGRSQQYEALLRPLDPAGADGPPCREGDLPDLSRHLPDLPAGAAPALEAEVTSAAAADAARRRRWRETEQEAAAAAAVASVEAAAVASVEAAAAAAVAEAGLPRDLPKATLQRKQSFDRQMKFLLKAEQQQEEAPL